MRPRCAPSGAFGVGAVALAVVVVCGTRAGPAVALPHRPPHPNAPKERPSAPGWLDGIKRAVLRPRPPRAAHRGGDPAVEPKEVGGYAETTAVQKQELVKEAFLWSWTGYKRYAWGKDSLVAVEKRGTDEGITMMAATIVDSLDTLAMLGLAAEREEAVEWVVTSLNVRRPVEVSFFEVSIRILGGLLSAHAQHRDPRLLKPAVDLGEALLAAFRPHHSLPCSHINLVSAACGSGKETTLANAGTMLMEFRELSRVTGNPEFEAAARRAEQALVKSAHSQRPRGLLPEHLSINDAAPVGGDVQVDGGADSFYEYLPKLWLQGNRSEKRLRDVFGHTVDALLATLLVEAPQNNWAMLGRVQWSSLQQLSGGSAGGSPDPAVVRHAIRPIAGHLSCFFPGTLALFGARSGQPRYVAMAERLMRTCWQLYNTTSGVGAEYFRVTPGGTPEFTISATDNKLRPEVVESLMYLYRVTKKDVYREWGWRAFAAWERHARVATGGYCQLQDVQSAAPRCKRGANGQQHSFWLTETLKYLWLLFDDGTTMPLDRWVFTTEAHPLPVAATHPHVLHDVHNHGG